MATTAGETREIRRRDVPNLTISAINAVGPNDERPTGGLQLVERGAGRGGVVQLQSARKGSTFGA